MNADHKAKIQEGRAKAAAQYARQVIKIDDNWIVRRIDELNWGIERIIKGKPVFQGYYGTIIAAFKALPAKILSDEAKTSLACVMECQKAINDRIESALWDAKKLTKTP